jgi:hypothetical protein
VTGSGKFFHGRTRFEELDRIRAHQRRIIHKKQKLARAESLPLAPSNDDAVKDRHPFPLAERIGWYCFRWLALIFWRWPTSRFCDRSGFTCSFFSLFPLPIGPCGDHVNRVARAPSSGLDALFYWKIASTILISESEPFKNCSLHIEQARGKTWRPMQFDSRLLLVVSVCFAYERSTNEQIEMFWAW